MNRYPIQTQLTHFEMACLLQQHTEWRLTTIETIIHEMTKPQTDEDIRHKQGILIGMMATTPLFIEIHNRLSLGFIEDEHTRKLAELSIDAFADSVRITEEFIRRYPELNVTVQPTIN